MGTGTRTNTNTIAALAAAIVLICAGSARADEPASGTPKRTGGGSSETSGTKPSGAKPSGAKPSDAKPSDADTSPVRTEPTAFAATAAPKDVDEALRRLARVKASCDFKDVSLAEVAEFVGKVSRQNVIVSPLLAAKGDGATPKVTFRLTAVTMRQVAEVAAKMTGTRLAVRDGVLQFTTPEDARGEPVLRIYDLGDLTHRLRNVPGPDIRLHLASAEWKDEEESDVENAFSDAEKVVETLKKMTGDGTWDDEKVDIRTFGERRIVVRQYPEVHKEIVRLLAMLRQFS
ncbi:MAG: hypothetical protein HMLKMBBP_00666 [Planctomycetes bacterium]|nr:hypothetical protein [Planctomycetota bacterium]